MTVFSQLVDEVMAELKRPDLHDAICDYTNQTIRELHINRDNGITSTLLFPANRFEEWATNTQLPYSESEPTKPMLWRLPRVQTFQMMESVYYPVSGIYPKERNPKTALLRNDYEVDQDSYWYRSGDVMTFHGQRRDIGPAMRIMLSWFEYPRSLAYFPKSKRPTVWDRITGRYSWNSKAEYSREDSLLYSTNWVLQRHEDLIKEGVRAKTFKRMGESERSSSSFALFSQMRPEMHAEAITALGLTAIR